ncbi:metal ABC transporter ATP-binding protein [Rothia sp. P13129]|uniref:metal ABC transporter ATP-binding protein n=1 Tax=Rothia sp. P13129 TaxID=3402664 RepID=UPI003ACE6AE7
MSAIKVTGVSAHYGSVHALDDVNFSVEPGRICGLIGMNGSGKSTLFKTMMGVHRDCTGTVTLDGHSPQQARSTGVVSYVPQSEEIDFTFPVSVRDVVSMGTYWRLGTTRRLDAQAKQAVARALERVELTDLAERQIGELSGGQRKRAFVARAMAQGTNIFLLDEPFAGVDKRSEKMIVSLLNELAQDGATILVSTHDLSSLSQLATEAILLRRTVLAHADVETVLRPENLMKVFGTDVLSPQ